jgi:sugar diacid utilization regulator
MLVDDAGTSVDRGSQGGLDLDVYRATFRAFRDVGEAVANEVQLDALLHLIVDRICELCSIRRCSLYLRDQTTGLFKGQVHMDAQYDEAIQRTVAGIIADRFTQEIVETKSPVLIRDTLRDPRPIRSTMRAWNIRAMLGVPMLASGEIVGICYLDNGDEPHPFSTEHIEIASTFANLAAVAITQAQLQQQRRKSVQAVARQNELLRRARNLDEQLTRLVLDNASIADIAQTVTRFTGKPCAIYDDTGRRLAMAPDGSEHRTLFDAGGAPETAVALASLGDDGSGVVDAIPALGVHHRSLVVQVAADEEVWGHVVVIETERSFGPLDKVVAGRAALVSAIQLAAARRAARARGDARDALAIDLIRGSHAPEALQERADLLGVRLEGPHLVLLFSAMGFQPEPAPSTREVVAALRAVNPDVRVLATSLAEGIVAIVEADDSSIVTSECRDDIATMAEHLGRSHIVVGISSLCHGPDMIRRAYEEARELVEVAETYRPEGMTTVVAGDDLGAGRPLLCSADRTQVRRYVSDLISPLLDGEEDERSSELLATVAAFLDSSCSIRQAAARLGVHENTVRYRFGRIKTLTNLDVGSSTNDQLALQLALIVLRLEGRIDARRDMPSGALEGSTVRAPSAAVTGPDAPV